MAGFSHFYAAFLLSQEFSAFSLCAHALLPAHQFSLTQSVKETKFVTTPVTFSVYLTSFVNHLGEDLRANQFFSSASSPQDSRLFFC
jgi:hypothetical protein